jgi:TRAP transporter TAXI family solute receptor
MKPIRMFSPPATALGTALLISLSQAAFAADLPSNMTWTAYGTTSSGYAQSVAIGNMLKNNYGTTLSIQPGKNDVSRMAPLKNGKAGYCACGIASYFGSEGVALFANPKWGPQPIRLLMTSIGRSGLGLGTAADAKVMTPKDLKGKRVAWVRGSDALNTAVSANLAFGGLTWKDVKKVEFSGFKASWEGLINDQVDAAFASTVTPLAKKLAASPRGIHWAVLAHNDEAGWSRLLATAPYFLKHTATAGAGISKQVPWTGSTYSYPILVTNVSHSEAEVAALVSAMIDHYAEYKDGAPGASGWALNSQNFKWVLPFHKGAIKVYEEKGIWNADAEAHNQSLIKRQDVILATWNSFMAGDTPSDKAEFKKAWLALRAGALKKAGFEPIFM